MGTSPYADRCLSIVRRPSAPRPRAIRHQSAVRPLSIRRPSSSRPPSVRLPPYGVRPPSPVHLASIRPLSAVCPPPFNCCHDAQGNVRHAALCALAAFATVSDQGVANTMLELLEDSNEEVVLAAVIGLGKIEHDPANKEALIAALNLIQPKSHGLQSAVAQCTQIIRGRVKPCGASACNLNY